MKKTENKNIKEMDSPKERQDSIPNADRREALLRAGKYAVFTAAAMVTLLNPQKSYAGSTIPGDSGQSDPTNTM